MKKLLVTSALPYANGAIHIGHLVEYIQTDIWVRYWKLRGRDAIYLCADDTHGTPIMIRARAEGITPEELIAKSREEHLRDFTTFGIEFDNYYSTHSKENRALSSEIYLTLKEKGHIVEKEIEQAFCPNERIFLPDRFIKGQCPNCGALDQYGDACEKCSKTYNAKDLIDPHCANCGATPEWRPSSHAFFRVNDFKAQLEEWLGKSVQGEIHNKLKEWFVEDLRDWDITRDAPYFGFEMPGRPGQFFYVWLDAPVGYMASTKNWCDRNGRDFDAYWRREDEAEVVHFIGKDISYFHALFWPALLMGSGFRTPTRLCVHGFLTVGGEKMSKSRGTFVTAESFARFLDPQTLRFYYATKLGPDIDDVDMNLEDFVLRVNSDMLGKIANIPSRVLKVLHKFCGGRVGELDDPGRGLLGRVLARRDEVATAYERREFSLVARLLSEVAGEINVFLEEKAPWGAVPDDERARICAAALSAFKVLATYVQPILPSFGEKFAAMMRIVPLTWDGLEETVENREVEAYETLVNRIDSKQVAALVAANRTEAPAESPAVAVPALTADALATCRFAAATVLSAEPMTDTDALVRLRLSVEGSEVGIVSGLGHDEDPGRLIGREILLLRNLEPRKIRGQMSEGMLLAAEVDGRVVPVVFE